MPKIFLKISVLCVFFALCAFSVAGQIPDASTASGKPKDEELPTGFYETLAKKRIEAEKKEYDELLAKGETLIKISEELEKSFESENGLTNEDTKKIDELEKTVKKIRSDLGAKDDSSFQDSDDEEEKTDKPYTPQNIVKNIKDVSSKLMSDLKKNTRYTISVFSLQSSNSLLKMIRLLKLNNR